MYRFFKIIYWLVRFKKEKRDFELAAEFHKAFQPEGDERDKAVGSSLMSAEKAQEKYEAAKSLFK